MAIDKKYIGKVTESNLDDWLHSTGFLYPTNEIQLERFKNKDYFNNSQIKNKDIKIYCKLSNSSESIMKEAFLKYKFSGRTYNKLLKVSRTIADLDGKKDIEDKHILEAIRYRTLDNKYWGS